MSGGPVRREKHIKTGGSGLHVNGPAAAEAAADTCCAAAAGRISACLS